MKYKRQQTVSRLSTLSWQDAVGTSPRTYQRLVRRCIRSRLSFLSSTQMVSRPTYGRQLKVKRFVCRLSIIGVSCPVSKAAINDTSRLTFDLGDPTDTSIKLRPLEPASGQSLARDLVLKTRRRKGLGDQIAVSKYLDDEFVVSAIRHCRHSVSLTGLFSWRSPLQGMQISSDSNLGHCILKVIRANKSSYFPATRTTDQHQRSHVIWDTRLTESCNAK